MEDFGQAMNVYLIEIHALFGGKPRLIIGHDSDSIYFYHGRRIGFWFLVPGFWFSRRRLRSPQAVILVAGSAKHVQA
jgi:hypothetical protein